MAKPVRVTYFRRGIEDKPGAMLAIAKELKSKNISLLGSWGFGGQTGQGELTLIPKSPEKLASAWKAAGVSFQEGTGFFVKGADRTGALISTLETLSREGINITATGAVAVGGNYGAFFWVAPDAVEKTAAALGAK
jgi:hypothetical protein